MTQSVWSTRRLVLSWGTTRSASFADRVAAAAEAGFDSVGLAIPDYLAVRASGWSDEEMLRVLADHGVTIDEAEVLFGFHATPGPAGIPERPGLSYADPEQEQIAFHLADVFGVRHVQAVGTLDDRPCDAAVTDAFAALCDRAAPHGLKVALEFVPYSNIPDVATAAAIVDEAARSNGGLCVDTWHFFRGDPDLATLGSLRPESVFMVQINDGPMIPADANRMTDAVHNRRCPGDGEFALREFLAALDREPMAASVSVEIYSDELDRLPSREAARRAHEAASAILEQASRSRR